MVASNIGESSSPPTNVVVSEGNNEIYDCDMYDNDDLIAYENIPTRIKCQQNIIQEDGELAGNPNDYRR